ncbi:hypothetical protein [Tenacibaculum geojense]|uniref:Uncharacterized protein n=1 Tax=Tenacibaculum geojense TaxID=915352 RepID=A0ABW3JWI6_9FLAO
MQKEKERISEGERFISDYFKNENLNFEREKRIFNLKGDSKSYRDVDFFLKDYGIYVEFYGRWNHSKAERERYREKKKAYSLNKIPCIYLYPENLGIIDFCFSKRMVETLEKHGMKKELFKYRLKRLLLDRGGLFFWILLSTLILLFGNSKHENNDLNILFFGIIIYQLYRLYDGYKKFFKSTKYYV